jgi:beta-glucosidase-like glycosyl hydrolase/CubicO group peptidase (beta-lactamase class C family)
MLIPRIPRYTVAYPVVLVLSLGVACSSQSIRRPSQTDGTAWVDSVLAGMSLEQKVSQLFVVQAQGVLYNEDDPDYRRLVELVERFEIGGFAFSSGTPIAQALLTNDLQARSRVPLLIAQDMEWGAGMRLSETTTFPRAMSLGATRRPDLARAMGRAVAREARAIGVHMNYAPVADINNNPNNPVINVRSFGERADLVGDMDAAYILGMKEGGLLSTVKHFPGHGDTDVDSHSGLPILRLDRKRLDSLELKPFERAIEAGAEAVMVAHVALPMVENGDSVAATLSKPIITGILRHDLRFDGLVVTDAMRMQAIVDEFGAAEAAVRSIEAGVDLILMSSDFYAARRAVLQAVGSGRISAGAIDKAVRHVLRAKVQAGLQHYRPADLDKLNRNVAKPVFEALAEEIARDGVTLLRNEGSLVPIHDRRQRILEVTVSDGSDVTRGMAFKRRLTSQTPEAYVTHRLVDRRSSRDDLADILDIAKSFDMILVQAYVSVHTGSGQIGLLEREQHFLDDLIGEDPPSILVSFGNPYIAMGLDAPDVYIAAYDGSSAAIRAVLDGLFGRAGFVGKLPVTIPGLYAYGDGITTTADVLRFGRPEDVGMSSSLLNRLDTLVWHAIEDTAFPGAAVVAGRAGVVVKDQGYGYFTYDSDTPTTTRSLFDLASLTKVVATTPAIMTLYERGQIDLNAPLAKYLPEFGQAGKESVTVRQILTHTSGLKPFYSFEQMGVTTREEILDFIERDSLVYPPDTEYRYSDLGMIMLAVTVERITGQPFGDFLRENIYEPMGMFDTGFRPAGGLGTSPDVVPTEIDTAFRGGLVQGEVHDERAWMLGGTAGHAGLFSTAEDLARYAAMYLNGGEYNGHRFFRPETIALFTTRFPSTLESTRALGWDTRSLTGYSSAGRLFGPRSFGHTGFTGTSLWIDPDAKLFVILLTNRVYPTRSNRKIGAVRPRVADVVFQSITGPPTLDLSAIR